MSSLLSLEQSSVEPFSSLSHSSLSLGKGLVHPNYCGKVWTQLLDDDGLNEANVSEMQNDPKV